jgi:hypothetical protein
MGELNVNSELASHLREHGDSGHEASADGGMGDGHKLRRELIEIFEAVLLALVAITTAWSGYQSARWDGESARAYATSSRVRAESVQTSLSSGQTVLYNTNLINAWFQSTQAGDEKYSDFLVRRMTPEYRVAFEAWVKTDPIDNTEAPPGPRYMPEYKDPLAEKAALLDEEATKEFEKGVHDREIGESYVRLTVILAAVLFLIAVGQRFKVRGVRIAVNVTASAFLMYAIVLVISYKRT